MPRERHQNIPYPMEVIFIKENGQEHMLFQSIREARRSQKLTMKKLGERSGLSGELIRSIEAGRRASTLESLSKIAQGLGSGIMIRLERAEIYIRPTDNKTAGTG